MGLFSDPHRRLLLLLTALVTIAALTGLVVLEYLKHDLIERSGQSLALEASHTADKLDRLLFERYADLRLITRVIRHQWEQRPFFSAYVTSIQQSHPAYLWIGVADERGRVIASTDPATLHQDRSNESWFHAAQRRRLTVEDMRPHDELNGGAAITFASPIHDADGRFRGVVVALVGREDIQALIEGASQHLQPALSGDLQYTVVNEHGDVLMDSLLGQPSLVRLTDRPSIQALHSSWNPGYVEEHSAAPRGSVITGYAHTHGYQGFRGLDWTILVSSPRDAVLAPITRVTRLVGFAGVGIMLPLLGLLAWTTTHLRRSQRALRTAHYELEQRAHMLAASREQLQALTAELSRTESRERQRLATELHDGLGQILALANLKFSMLPGAWAPGLAQVKELIDEALRFTRTFVTDLRPPLLGGEDDLLVAIEWVAKKMERLGLKVQIQDDGRPKPLEEERLRVLYQTVQELLVNVLKHSRSVDAAVSLRRTNGFLEVCVQDFGREFDVSTVRPPSEQGGFGLFSIRERLTLLGGRLELTSVVGEGTLAKVTIPLHGFPLTTLPSAATMSAQALTRREEPSSYTIRILLADDHAILREGLRRIIEEHDDMMVVAEAADGEAAVQATRLARPDVVIMDVNMPKLNGVEATRAIRVEYPDTVVIGLSMHEEAHIARAMAEAGAWAYVAKNEATVLVQLIRKGYREGRRALLPPNR